MVVVEVVVVVVDNGSTSTIVVTKGSVAGSCAALVGVAVVKSSVAGS